jgi:hypothetical protein
VNWAVAVLPPLNCAHPEESPPPATLFQVSYVEPEAGKSLAVVLASCTTGAGVPPVGFFVYDGATSTTNAHLFEVLLDPDLDRQANSFTLNGSTISMTQDAYSSGKVPRCCPDLESAVQWNWVDGTYQGIPAAAVGTAPLGITVMPSSPTAKVGDNIIYTVAVENHGLVPVTDVHVIPEPTLLPCSGDCHGAEALAWQPGSPNCGPDDIAVFGVSCKVGTLVRGASARVSITMLVKSYLNPLTFEPVVVGVMPAGRTFRTGAATVAVQP